MTGKESIEYSQLNIADLDEVVIDFQTATNSDASAGSPNQINNFGVIRNDYPYPISRPPTKQRDWLYGIAFLAHFLGIIMLSAIEKTSLQHAVISYNRAGSWASMVMIITLIGSFIGGMAAIFLVMFDYRVNLMQFALLFSLIMKVVMGNIMLIMRSSYSFLGLIVLIDATWDSFRYKAAKAALSFSDTLIQMISDVSRAYGIWLAVTCGAVVAAQTLVLLWWGAFFIGAISTIPTEFIVIVATLLLLSLYWITSFFQQMLSFIIGGSILWLFVREEASSDRLSSKLWLYITCSLSTSFGSLCKAAMFTGPAQFILHSKFLLIKHAGRSYSCCRFLVRWTERLCQWAFPFARRYHRLSLCLIAVYGRTLVRTAEDQMQYHPETLNSAMEETTGFTLGCLSACIAGSISILFGLCAERGEVDTWPLFIFVCFCLSYSGASLALSAYSSAVDALIVSASLNPAKVAQENQIVLLRFMRTAEIDPL